MPRNRWSVEQIINHLREAEVPLTRGRTVAEACRHIGVVTTAGVAITAVSGWTKSVALSSCPCGDVAISIAARKGGMP